MSLRQYFESVGGVSSTSGLAEYLGVAEPVVRWGASENSVPKVGGGYAWTLETAEAFATTLGLDTGDDDEDGVELSGDEEEDVDEEDVDEEDVDDEDSYSDEDEDEDEEE